MEAHMGKKILFKGATPAVKTNTSDTSKFVFYNEKSMNCLDQLLYCGIFPFK